MRLSRADVVVRTIRGLSDVYSKQPWSASNKVEAEPRLFDLHTTCALKAGERLGDINDTFHITWMDIRADEENSHISPHIKWQRKPLHGSHGRNIGMVAGSVSRPPIAKAKVTC